jgi:hypothetical protein
MISVKRLSPSVVEEILNTVDPQRQFSESQISEVTSTLNNILSNYALSEEERNTEPTAKKLNKQIAALDSALRRLKLALPQTITALSLQLYCPCRRSLCQGKWAAPKGRTSDPPLGLENWGRIFIPTGLLSLG